MDDSENEDEEPKEVSQPPEEMATLEAENEETQPAQQETPPPAPPPGPEEAPEEAPQQPAQQAAQPAPEQAPQPASQPTPAPEQPPPKKPLFGQGMPMSLPNIKIPQPRILLSIIAIVIIAALILTFTPSVTTTTTTSTTTVQQVNLSRISACEQISKPGTYYLEGSINDTSTSGACISVASSNVRIVGNLYTIAGSGPYSGLPPYSYGIEVRNVSNVTVTTFRVLKFSYDLFVSNSKNVNIVSNNLTTSTLSAMYLLNVSNSTVHENSVSDSQSKQGGIFLVSGSGNSFFNNSVANNAYYGIVVNSTDNNFTRNTFGGNAADIACNLTSAARFSNNFSNSKCAINDYCAFASCSTNVPFNISAVKLAPGPVSTCGSIYSPGNYVLSQSISASAYLNLSNPLSQSIPCIKILAPNVNFDCNNHAINNSGYGIYVGATSNVNVSRCALSKDSYGIFVTGAFNPQIRNTSAQAGTYGVYISNTTGGRLSNVTLAKNNTYGLFVDSTSGLLLDSVRAQSNVYGVYINSGENDVFNGGVTRNNTKADIYCSPGTYNSTTDLAQSVSCGVTDCNWASASCAQTVQPKLSVYPINSCRTITNPGNYTLTQNTLSSGTCFDIQSNNVAFSCASHLIVGPSPKSAFYIASRRNVSISNCIMSGFGSTVNVTNSSQIDLNDLTINDTKSGVVFSKVSNSSVTNLKVTLQSSFAYNFTGVNTSLVSHDIAFGGLGQGSGFLFSNSGKNTVSFNNATSNPLLGFSFVNSRDNTVYNNSAFSNRNFDYSCSGSSTGLYSNPISINSGLAKNQCGWMVVVNPLAPSSSACLALFSPSQVVLGSDMLYAAGSTCISAYVTNTVSANTTTIDCAGHTVYASHGGTFAYISGAAGVKVYNCILLNFTTGVRSTGAGTLVYNNTFNGGGTAVLFNSTNSGSVYKNMVYNISNGLLFYNSISPNVHNNVLFNSTVGIGLYGGSSATVANNTATRSGTGLLLSNSTGASVQNNTFVNSSQGSIVCSGTATNSTSRNIDDGGNTCQNPSSTCTWISLSSSCRA